MLETFKINELFGNLNVNLKLSNLENIYIGENGIGKTTILSTVFNTLKGKWMELLKIDFNYIELKLDDINYKFFKEDLKLYLDTEINRKNLGRMSNIIEADFGDEMLELLPLFEHYDREIDFIKSEEYRRVASLITQKIGLPSGALRRTIIDFLGRQNEGTKMLKILDEKLNYFNEKNEILYFPTFRRIEEDLNKLLAFSSEDKRFVIGENQREFAKYDGLIKFGMNDVDTIIENLLDEIKRKSISSFNQMTALLLKQYVNDDFDNDKLMSAKFNINNLKISLDRVGSEIESIYKDKIITLVEN